ncbi:MAG: pentapeptide repeat-containing protein, partial [Pseudanabaena sp. LacPavin_0818_WC45_MAG_42_6]|nr:pentapeptide repeat-containing protein [Pseudanabaena sp. LacPavin_0818_WC45_MAG_42_6]
MTSTAKTFAGQNLRGRSFKGQDLSGADFSDTDLRGANFTGATLIGANFSKAETGVQKRWVAFQLVISFFLSELAGIFVA